MGAKPSKGTPKDRRLRENAPGKRTYKPDPKPSKRHPGAKQSKSPRKK